MDLIILNHKTNGESAALDCRFLSELLRHSNRELCTETATRGLLAMALVILNHGQVTWTTPELASALLLTTTSHQREDVSALGRFSVHRCPTRRVFNGTGIELVTCQPRSYTLTTRLPRPRGSEAREDSIR
ncbi:uncharacterized protein TNCV_4855011 [Trichonephila clavipes]|nr:uncharacterized protein TNCV_4855011 [Trichonephila clavipes]